MTLEQVYFASQIISALAVLGSLVFVGLQIRQNSRLQRVVAVDTLAAAIIALNKTAMESPAVGDAVSKAMRDWSAASREQRIIAHYFLFSMFKLLENAWYQKKAHVLEPGQWSGWETILRTIYHSPGIQSGWWPHRRQAYSLEFQDFLAGTTPLPGNEGSLGDIFDDVQKLGDFAPAPIA